MDDKQVTGSGSPHCSTGAMGCLLPVSLLLVFGAAMVVAAAAAFFFRTANLSFTAIAIGLLALVVFFAFGIAVLIFLFVRGGVGFGGRCCRPCCCECSCSCGCTHSEKAKA